MDKLGPSKETSDAFISSQIKIIREMNKQIEENILTYHRSFCANPKGQREECEAVALIGFLILLDRALKRGNRELHL